MLFSRASWVAGVIAVLDTSGPQAAGSLVEPVSYRLSHGMTICSKLAPWNISQSLAVNEAGIREVSIRRRAGT